MTSCTAGSLSAGPCAPGVVAIVNLDGAAGDAHRDLFDVFVVSFSAGSGDLVSLASLCAIQNLEGYREQGGASVGRSGHDTNVVAMAMTGTEYIANTDNFQSGSIIVKGCTKTGNTGVRCGEVNGCCFTSLGSKCSQRQTSEQHNYDQKICNSLHNVLLLLSKLISQRGTDQVHRQNASGPRLRH